MAVVQTLGIVNTPEVRILLLNYGYFQMNGPWRSCYIRYGYDPRKDSEARRYQILDFRTNPLTRPVMGVRATKPAFVPLNR